MNPRINYEMTENNLKELLSACKPTPVMFLPGGTPIGGTPQENANAAWAKLGKKMGFDSMTVQPSNKGQRFFTAVPSETEDQKTSRIEREQKEFNEAECLRLNKEIEERKIQLQEISKKVLLSRDGNQWCATEKDFINLQESPAGFGDTPEDAIASLRKH